MVIEINTFFSELTSFKGRRVVAFRKNLIEMAELEIKHAKVSAHIEAVDEEDVCTVRFSSRIIHGSLSLVSL